MSKKLYAASNPAKTARNHKNGIFYSSSYHKNLIKLSIAFDQRMNWEKSKQKNEIIRFGKKAVRR